MTVVAELLDGFECKTHVLDSGHIVVGDEPESLGGENKGPNPFAFLQMSLANCTIVTLVGVAYEKGITLGDVTVRVSHKQNMKVSGPKDPQQRQLKMTELRRTIILTGSYTEEEKEALLWGANHCPVSNTLEGGVDMVTRLQVEA